MAFLTSRDNDTPESLDELLSQAQRALEAGEVSRADYDAEVTRLQARRAMLTVEPVQDANAGERVRELDYLLEKGWISPEEYRERKREILGEGD